MQDKGIAQAAGEGIVDALPLSWLNRSDAPAQRPDYAVIYVFTGKQHKNLMAQIAYEKSKWNYNKIGNNNSLGRYQISPARLEDYGLISTGANAAYGNECVNYRNAWRPKTDSKSYYNFQVEGQKEFLNNHLAQEQLAYQIIYDLYNQASKIAVIKPTDTVETIAGMLFVCWELGVGASPNKNNNLGTGAWAWRYSGIGTGARYYNSGRYAISVLSQ